jgi:hypothetical protein
MANPYRPETLRRTAATSRLQIATPIEDLWRSVEVLAVDIEHEEMRAHLGSIGLATFALRVCFILSF